MQCRGNLCNVDATFAVPGYYQKINRSFKINVAQTKMHWVSCAKLSGVSRVALHKVFTCCFQYCSKSVTTTLSRIFSCAMLSGAFLTTFYEVFTCAMLSQKYSLGKYWTRYFPAQCCLEPLGQHYTSFLPVPCYLKSVKTTLNKIFFLCDFVWSLFDKIA